MGHQYSYQDRLNIQAPPLHQSNGSFGGGGGWCSGTIFTVILKQCFSFIFIHKLVRVVIFYLQIKIKCVHWKPNLVIYVQVDRWYWLGAALW
jgi:hypothetical protein